MAPPVYSSGPQHMFSPYAQQQLPPPPPYQYAQLYPTHVSAGLRVDCTFSAPWLRRGVDEGMKGWGEGYGEAVLSSA